MGSRITATIIGAAVLVGGYAVVQGGGGGSDTANLWVTASAGSCTRSATPVDFAGSASPDARCGDFSTAYQAAACGDTVYVKAGSYSGQTVNRDSSKDACSSRVVIAGAPGESVTVNGDLNSGQGGAFPLPTQGADHVEFKDFALNGGMYVIGSPLTDFHATNIDANGRFTIQGAEDSSITGGDWGPCTATQIAPACPMLIEADSSITNNGLLIEGNTFHDVRCDGQEWDCHIECMKINGGTNLTIRGNVYRDCALYDIFLKSEHDNDFSGLLIENNQFDATWNEASGGASQGRTQAVSFSCGAGELTNATIRFNSFHEASVLSPDEDGCGRNSNVSLVGNIIGGTACSEGVGQTWSYNVFLGSDPCSGTGNTTVSDFPYVDENFDGNFRLAGSATVIDNLVPTSAGCPTTDIDGDARPAGTNCDAGMDER